MRSGKLLTYDELLAQYPDWTIWEADLYHKESTEQATESSRLSRIVIVGHAVAFAQKHGLLRRVLCENAPNIPVDFKVFLRDVTPEGLEFYRTGYKKWLGRFERNMHADPSDVRIMEKALVEMRAKSRRG